MNNFYEKAREQMYKEHRERVLNARSMICTHHPKPLKDRKEPLTFEEYLAQIVERVRPNIFTFTKSPESLSMTQIQADDYQKESPRRQPTTKKSKSRSWFTAKQTSRQNRLIKDRDIFWEDGELHVRAISVVSTRIPPQVLQRYRELSLIKDTGFLRKLLRPKIFLEFYAERNGRSMGHLEIQLFTEACPAVVLEFVRMCTRGERERLIITHVVDSISLECELALSNTEILTEETFEYDTNAVDHGDAAGILTCPLRYVHGTRNNRLRFSITLRPLGMLNGKRVAFGRAFGDLRLLQKVQRFAKSKNSNLGIRVKTCGIEK